MVRPFVTFALAATVLLAPALAFAEADMPRVDKRQEKQEQRIQDGIENGSLNQYEQNRLERGMEHVENLEERATADGVVTNRERLRLHRAQNVESARIYRQKHDRQN
jgi:hypothetical protein